jgi:hypothetical protein
MMQNKVYFVFNVTLSKNFYLKTQKSKSLTNLCQCVMLRSERMKVTMHTTMKHVCSSPLKFGKSVFRFVRQYKNRH